MELPNQIKNEEKNSNIFTTIKSVQKFKHALSIIDLEKQHQIIHLMIIINILKMLIFYIIMKIN